MMCFRAPQREIGLLSFALLLCSIIPSSGKFDVHPFFELETRSEDLTQKAICAAATVSIVSVTAVLHS